MAIIRNTLGRLLRRRDRTKRDVMLEPLTSGSMRGGGGEGGLITQAVMDNIASMIRERVIQRTLSGYDFEMKRFVPYSPQYAKHKGVGINDVNLRLSGEMLDTFYVEVKRTPEHENEDIWFIDLGYLSIHYGFRDDKYADKYYWNADNQYGKNRDFLGVQQGRPLLPMRELLEIIKQAVRGR